MQFALICRDAPDALARRLAARDAHMQTIHEMKAAGSILDGGAILSDDGTMVGSVVFCDFKDRTALDAYLEAEIYVRNEVWRDIEIIQMKRVAWRD